MREAEDVLVSDGNSPAEVGVDTVELDPEPMMTAPFVEAPVDVVVGALEPSPVGLVLGAWFEPGVVVEDVAPP